MGRLLVVGELLRPRSAVTIWVDPRVDLERFTDPFRNVLTHPWRFGELSLLEQVLAPRKTFGLGPRPNDER